MEAAMAEPKYWKTKILLAKSEVTYGTDPTPTGASNAILASDVTFAHGGRCGEAQQ
jgi:hypothetical protein